LKEKAKNLRLMKSKASIRCSICLKCPTLLTHERIKDFSTQGMKSKAEQSVAIAGDNPSWRSISKAT
jgi:hypothetical protein